MKQLRKTLTCLLLVVCMVIGLFPVSALAAEKQQDSSVLRTTTTLPSKADNFTDVKKTSWYYDAVHYVVDNGIFAGVSDTAFDPHGTMTRAMVVSVLSRMAGIDPEEYKSSTAGFKDVKSGSWYAPSVEWAVKYGITAGTGNGKFSPDRAVTRQEMAVLFVRYFTLFGVSLGDENLSDTKPDDFDSCADWAKDSVLVLWQRGLMVGDGSGNFYPEKVIERAECAALCMQIHKTVSEWKDKPAESPWVPVTPGGEGSYKVAFYNEDGELLTTMKAKNGTGLGAENVPYYPDPDIDNGVYFWGWFYYSSEEEKPHLFNTLYPYNEDMELHAFCGTQAEVMGYLEDECYIIEGAVGTDFTVTIRPITPNAEFDPDYDLAVYANEYDRRTEYEIEQLENGDYVIHIDGYQPGVYYTMALNKDFVFLSEVTGEPLDEMIRYIEFYIDKPVNTELQFRDGIIWLPTSEAQYYAQVGGDSGFGKVDGFGVVRPADDTETELGHSIFTYNPQTNKYTFDVGTILCVYSDDKVTLNDAEGNPIEVQRLAPNVRDYDEAAYEGLGYSYADLYDGTNDAFYIVTEVSQATDNRIACSYRELNSNEISQILYVPDIIPFMVSKLPTGTTGTIENYAAYDAELYAGYSGDKKPEPKVGDFVTVYTSDLRYYSESDFEAIRSGEYKGKIPYVYGKITAIDGMKLTYELVSQDEVVGAMNYIDDYYVERYIPKSLQPVISDDEIAKFEEDTEALLDEQTIRAFISTAIEEDAEQGGEEARQALELLQNNDISISAVRKIEGLRGSEPDNSKAIEVTGKEVAFDVDFTHLSYIPNTTGKWPVSVNIGMMLIVKLRLREGVNLYYAISANFTQEVAVGVKASGRFDVKWYFCVPVPKHVEFSLTAMVDTATDVTLDIRHFTIDKTHMGKQSLYGRQADAQEMWQNFQEFLLSDAFITHGAALYSKEAEYYALVEEANAIPKSKVNEREAAEIQVRLKAKEINDMWDNKEYGLDAAWNRFYLQGGSAEWNEMQSKAAEKAALEAKDELTANLVNIGQRWSFTEKIVDKFTKDTKKATDDAMQELADLDADGKETEEWKKAQEAIEAAKTAEKNQRKVIGMCIDDAYDTVDKDLRLTQGYLKAAVNAVDTLLAQMRVDKTGNAAAIEKAESARDGVQTALNIVTTTRKVLAGVKHVVDAARSCVAVAKKDTTGMNIVGEFYRVAKDLNLALKDCKLILADLQESYFEPGSEDYQNCKEGIADILWFTEKSDFVLDLFHTLAVILDANPGSAESTDGITNVPTTSKYWKFRAIRSADFQEFSLNTEILNKLVASDDELTEKNIAPIANKYAEMCAISNTWMDLYRKELGSLDIPVPIFPGLDVTIGADFVVQANVNIAANFNFHVEYGKEFSVKVDVLDWDFDTASADRTNQKLSISVIAMGTLGFRVGFELKLGVKIIKIFSVTATVEIMPYVNLYAYVFFQYNRDLHSGASEAKLKGAMYIDIGIHIGFNLALKLDILVYKNTWKWNLWNKNITLADIGERRNVYNFYYSQPSIDALTGTKSDVETALNGTDAEKSELNTSPDGLLIVNSATDYQIPACARDMGFMDMTNGALGHIGFDAGHYKYTFFTVPKEHDGNTYTVANNLPLYYELVEMPVLDEEGNIVYEENDGAGIPLDITVEIDETLYKEQRVIATNSGTPVTEMVPSDKLVVDTEGIAAGKYVVDTRFSADKNGRITFTPETGATGGTYAQDVYVYLEWQDGALEVSNYPVRRIVHILWTNENPISWLNFEVVLVEQNRITQQNDEYTVWSDTSVKGYDSVYIPPLNDVLDGVDEQQMIYDREKTTYTGTAKNDGTLVPYPQEGHTYYIRADLKKYSLQVHGYTADGNDRTETYTEEYGYKLPIPKTFTETVTTTDPEGHPQYLAFAGYVAEQEKDGQVETWTGKWDEPIDTALALDLTDPSIPRYLRAVYTDETVKAKFTFVGVEREPVVQYLRRGSAPDGLAIDAIINQMKLDAAAEGKTLNVEWAELPGVLRSDKVYVINCRTTFIDPPTVTQIGSSLRVKLSSDAEMDADDIIYYGFVPNDEPRAEVEWLPAGEDTVEVADGVEYSFFACLVDGETLDSTYSAAAIKTITGTDSDVGYETYIYLTSADANPTAPVLVKVQVQYTTGVFSTPQTLTMEAGGFEELTLDFDGNPDKIASVYLTVTNPDGTSLKNGYKFFVSGEAYHPDRDDVGWATDNITLCFAGGSSEWQYARFAFEEFSLN